MKYYDRYSLKSLEKGTTDPLGSIFATPSGMVDLSPVKIVGTSIDTIRQLCSGVIKTEILAKLDGMVESKEQYIHVVDYRGHGVIKFAFNRMGKASGYRYMFQNADLGVIVLFGKYHGKLDDTTERSHLKIELSPHFISQRTVAQIHDFMFDSINGLANYFLHAAKPAGCEVHLAVDYQGFKLPDTFIEQFKTYSRTVSTFDGISSIDLSNISEAAVTYGKAGQERNYLIGKRKSIQVCAYDKTKEAKKSDKIDYFKGEWSCYTLGDFDDTITVRRIEARLHHSVVRECGLGQEQAAVWESFKTIEPFLDSLWVYAMERNWLKHDQASRRIHPFWQLLIQDAKFTINHQVIKIVRKKKQSVDPISHNLTAVIGNMISILERQGFTAKQIFSQVRILSFYPQIKAYYRQRGINEAGIKQLIFDGVEKRKYRGKAA